MKIFEVIPANAVLAPVLLFLLTAHRKAVTLKLFILFALILSALRRASIWT